MANLLPIACVLVACVGTSLLIASVSTTYWRKYNWYIAIHEGLFSRCTEYRSGEICAKIYKDYGDLPASFAGVIALMILGIIFEVLSVVVKVAGSLMEKKLNVLVGVLQLFAVICGAAGLSLYAKKYLTDKVDAGWSYIIGWLGECLIAIGLVLLLLVFMRR